MRAFCLSIYGLRSLCRNERIRRIPNLFLQLEAFLEGFADAFGHFIVAVSVSIEGDGIDQGHIQLAVYQYAFVSRHVYDFADDAAAAGA